MINSIHVLYNKQFGEEKKNLKENTNSNKFVLLKNKSYHEIQIRNKEKNGNTAYCWNVSKSDKKSTFNLLVDWNTYFNLRQGYHICLLTPPLKIMYKR